MARKQGADENVYFKANIVKNLAADIKLSFPDATGYSVRNLKYMAKFAAAFSG